MQKEEKGFRVLFRVDASAAIGVGHIMRCISLAKALGKEGMECSFATRPLSVHMGRLLREAGIEHEELPTESAGGEEGDAADCVRAFSARAWDLVILDHYGLGLRWQRAFRAHGRLFLAIDDIGTRDFDTDILLDQNLSSDNWAAYDSRVSKETVRLLGPRFALLREEFRSLRERERAFPEAPPYSALVFYGGSDLAGCTMQAIHALESVEAVAQVAVVVGSSNPRAGEIKDFCSSRPRFQFHMDVGDMARLVCGADVAFGAGGSSIWERACLGIPSLVTILADNQAGVATAAEKAGLLAVAGEAERLDVNQLRQKAEAFLNGGALLLQQRMQGMRAVDGLGAARMAAYLKARLGDEANDLVVFHPALEEHRELLRQWRNDPVVRSASATSHEVSEAEHATWFESAVLSGKEDVYLLKARSGWCGNVRFCWREIEQAWELSWLVAPSFRGRGIAKNAVRRAVSLKKGQKIFARIKADNLASKKAALHAGFRFRENSHGMERWEV